MSNQCILNKNKNKQKKEYKGGKISASSLNKFIKASYKTNKEAPEEIDGYIIDKKISNQFGKVYHNPTTGKAVVIHRGTKGIKDWTNNVAYGLSMYEHTGRYKKGKTIQEEAEAKYGKNNIDTVGHSQGAVLARKLGKDTQNIININPSSKGEVKEENEIIIKSDLDPVSILQPTDEKDIIIPHDSYNPLSEHSSDILDRLDPERLIGGKMTKKRLNTLQRQSELYELLLNFVNELYQIKATRADYLFVIKELRAIMNHLYKPKERKQKISTKKQIIVDNFEKLLEQTIALADDAENAKYEDLRDEVPQLKQKIKQIIYNEPPTIQSHQPEQLQAFMEKYLKSFQPTEKKKPMLLLKNEGHEEEELRKLIEGETLLRQKANKKNADAEATKFLIKKTKEAKKKRDADIKLEEELHAQLNKNYDEEQKNYKKASLFNKIVSSDKIADLLDAYLLPKKQSKAEAHDFLKDIARIQIKKENKKNANAEATKFLIKETEEANKKRHVDRIETKQKDAHNFLKDISKKALKEEANIDAHDFLKQLARKQTNKETKQKEKSDIYYNQIKDYKLKDLVPILRTLQNKLPRKIQEGPEFKNIHLMKRTVVISLLQKYKNYLK
jgi:hypothetical protein